jgi:pyrroline-5-carboxylate reductase
MKMTFIGLGNMATAIISGILAHGIVTPENIKGADKSASARDKAKQQFGISTTACNNSAVTDAEIIILAIKPQVAATVLAEVKDSIAAKAIIISIMAGKSTDWIAEQLTGTGIPLKIVRTMPNTPALVGEAMSGVCRNAHVSDSEMEICLNLWRSFGKAEEVPETLMDAVVGVSGSAPAYVFIFIEALADAAVTAGMPREQAYRFAAQNVLGSARMVLETGRHPGELKDMVCSPGGATIEAVKILEEKGFRAAVIAAANAAAEKSRGL